MSQAALTQSFLATLSDGEKRTLRNVEEFCHYYEANAKSLSLDIYIMPRGTKAEMEIIHVPDFTNQVTVRLPSRLHVENVHAVFARAADALRPSSVPEKIATGDERQDAGRVTIPAEAHGEPDPQPDPRKVFVVHGRNNRARAALFQLLRALTAYPESR